MRIVLISHTDSPWTPPYAGYFQEQGHDVHVISFHPKPLPGIQVHYFGASARTGELPKTIYLRRALAVRRLLRRLRPDVTLATYFRSNGLVGAIAKCGPLVLSTRGVDFDFPLPSFLNGPLIRWMAGRAESLHASSPELAEIFQGFGVPKERFTVIPLGTDAQQFRPREGPRAPGPLRILCTRKHHPLYDNPTIVRALALLRDEGVDFRCRFVGTGTTIQVTRDLVRALNLADRLELLGDLDHGHIPEQLVWADLYVSAARSDGSPSSLFEAMSCGHFPVVTDVVANRYWIRHRENGYLFRVGDPRDCAEGLRFAWQNPDRILAGGSLNRQTIIAKLDRNAGLVRLEELLKRAVDIHHRRSRSSS
jgi:glycosyltransferase involved in cell wall biosynthesis